MFEKVNPSHPDKIADRIAGAMVDLAYREQQAPKVAIEVLIGHQHCNIICESSYQFNKKDVKSIVKRIANIDKVNLLCVKQDYALAQNQKDKLRCGDNGIFKGVPITLEQKRLSNIARDIYSKYPYDGKYILSHGQLVICQSNATFDEINSDYKDAIINPLGFWTGGLKTDSGATNRKLGSDMGDAVTGGGLHGKDLSKADVSVNIYAFLKAKERKAKVSFSCAIGDDEIDGLPYWKIVKIAKEYIDSLGGFEKFAEWGLI